MTKDDIMKELDKFEIPYETDANKPVLQKLLDDELAKRASGDDSEPEDPVEAEPVDADEPELSDEARVAALEEAQAYLSDAEQAQSDVQARVAKARRAVAALTPKPRQASLAQCVAGLHESVKRDLAVADEVKRVTARNLAEAEAILDTDEAEAEA